MKAKKILSPGGKPKVKIMLAILAAILIILLGFNPSCRKLPESGDQLKVVATIYPLYDMARQVAGNKLEVVYLINPGESPHTFEFTPERIKRLQGAKIALKVGLGLDDWLEGTIRSLGTDIEIYDVHQGIDLIEEEGYPNPHVWLSLENAKVIVENIEAILSESFPQYSGQFAENKEGYINQINDLEDEFKKEAGSFKKKEFIAFHHAWGYLAEELGIVQVMSVEPFPGKEPTPEYIIELQKTINRYGIQTIFIEPQLSAQVVSFLAEDMELEVKVLDPLGGTEETDTYLKLMSYNFAQLKDALD